MFVNFLAQVLCVVSNLPTQESHKCYIQTKHWDIHSHEHDYKPATSDKNRKSVTCYKCCQQNNKKFVFTAKNKKEMW